MACTFMIVIKSIGCFMKIQFDKVKHAICKMHQQHDNIIWTVKFQGPLKDILIRIMINKQTSFDGSKMQVKIAVWAKKKKK